MFRSIVFRLVFLTCLVQAGSGSCAPADGDKIRITHSNETLYYVNSMPPVITASSSSLDFGSVGVGSSTTIRVTVTNTRAGALVIGLIKSPALPFTKTGDTCSGRSVTQNETCDITIQFAPTSHGMFNGAFIIPSNAANDHSLSLSLTGIGEGNPLALITPNPFDLGSVVPGRTTIGSITVLNAGSSDLTVGPLTNVGAPFSVLSTTCIPGNPLMQNRSCIVTVSFTPTTTGTFSRGFYVFSDTGGVPDTPVEVNLLGTGVLLSADQ